MQLLEKQASVEELSALFKGAEATYVLSYQGCSCEDLTNVRKDLRPLGASFSVVKNTLAKRALSDLSTKDGFMTDSVCSDFTSHFKGPVAVVWAKGDIVSPAKIIAKHVKAIEGLGIKVGMVEGKLVNPAGVDALATLPSREELISKLLAIMNAPATKLVQMISAPATQLVRTIEAWRAELEKK